MFLLIVILVTKIYPHFYAMYESQTNIERGKYSNNKTRVIAGFFYQQKTILKAIICLSKKRYLAEKGNE